MTFSKFNETPDSEARHSLLGNGYDTAGLEMVHFSGKDDATSEIKPIGYSLPSEQSRHGGLVLPSGWKYKRPSLPYFASPQVQLLLVRNAAERLSQRKKNTDSSLRLPSSASYVLVSGLTKLTQVLS